MNTNENLLIDGYMMAACIKSGALKLEKNESLINQLNVFPVPDGDTGTNMLTTLKGGINAATPCAHLGDYLSALSRGMLFGARGNSGVIFSMIFSGIAESLKNVDRADASRLLEALKNGSKVAYDSVAEPTEGTILTVVREGAGNIENSSTEGMDLMEFFRAYIENIRASLEKTPELLPVLKSAGVVDSGGYGFVKFFEGFADAVSNSEEQSREDAEYNALFPNGDISSKWLEDSEEDAFGFCTECIVILDDPGKNVREEVLEYLNSMGQSVVCVQKDEILKMHVHTLEPLKVLSHIQENYGTFFNVKVENMDTMFKDRLKSSKKNENAAKNIADYTADNTAENAADSIADSIQNNLVHESHAGLTFVAVADGEGVVKAFHENGVEIVLNGGQTMNTSVEEFVEAFRKVDTTDIVVLPNNSNIEAAAAQAARLFDASRVHIIPTHSIAEGYFALSMVCNYEEGIDKVVSSMTEGMQNIDTIWISKAIRDALCDGIECREGEYLALFNKKIVATGANCRETAIASFEKTGCMEEKYVAIIFKGRNATDEDADSLKEYIEENYGIDAGVIDGGQEVYDFVIGIMG